MCNILLKVTSTAVPQGEIADLINGDDKAQLLSPPAIAARAWRVETGLKLRRMIAKTA
jgi:hypothetical protein